MLKTIEVDDGGLKSAMTRIEPIGVCAQMQVYLVLCPGKAVRKMLIGMFWLQHSLELQHHDAVRATAGSSAMYVM